MLAALVRPSSHRRPVAFPKVRPHAPNTVQTPGKDDLSITGRMKQSIWRISDKLKQRNVKHAFRAGMATAVLASPAFYEKTRPIFMEYRGEWALVSVSGRLELRLDCKKTNSALQYFVVISPTIGAVSIFNGPDLWRSCSLSSRPIS